MSSAADAAALLRAADVLEERGWCRGSSEDEAGRVDLLGALQVALGGPADRQDCEQDAPQVAAEALRLLDVVVRSVGMSGTAGFNDDPSRDVDDILHALDRASKAA